MVRKNYFLSGKKHTGGVRACFDACIKQDGGQKGGARWSAA